MSGGVMRKPSALRRQHTAKDQTSTDVQLRAVELDIPKCPRGLLRETRRRWDAYWQSEVAQAADPNTDLHLIQRWIRDVDEYERMRPLLLKSRLVKGSTGQPKLSPLAPYLEQLRSKIERAEDVLGLSPRARAQLGLTFASARLVNARAAQARQDLDDEELEDSAPRPDPRLVLVQ